MKNVTNEIKQRTGDRAAQYFGNGYHCAEAVAAAVLEAIGEDPGEATAHATAFGGGFGRTYQEACGALSGALIVIGHLHGRRQAGSEWDLAAKFSAQIRQRFVNDFETAHCETLRNRFGPEKQMAECRNLTRTVATAMMRLLSEDPDEFTATKGKSPPESSRPVDGNRKGG